MVTSATKKSQRRPLPNALYQPLAITYHPLTVPKLTTPSIVMRKYDFRETSRILRLFTREAGILSALAKGAHRPKSKFLGALDLFFLLDTNLAISPQREIQLLTSASVLESHPRFAREPNRLACAAHLVEAAGLALPEGRPDPDLFDLLASGLSLIEKFPLAKLNLAVLAWKTRFLDTIGQGFNLNACPECGTPLPRAGGKLAFSITAGGPLCLTHREGKEVSWLPRRLLDLLLTFRQARATSLAQLRIDPEDQRSLSHILQAALEFRLESRLRTTGPMLALSGR